MKKNLFILLLSGFLISFAALFAKKINLPANVIVWWRCFISIITLTPILIASKKWTVPKDSIIWIIISGLLFGIHWWAFFVSIQMTTVSLAVVILFTFPLISTILEPLYNKSSISIRQLIGASGIILGVYLIVPEFSLKNSITMGVLYGIISATALAIRNIITRKKLATLPALSVLNHQMILALIIISVSFLLTESHFDTPKGIEIWYACLLAIPFTIAAHGMIAYSLKHFSAATVGVIGSLQVVYSFLFAFLFLGEIPELSSYFGAAVVTFVAIYEIKTRKP